MLTSDLTILWSERPGKIFTELTRELFVVKKRSRILSHLVGFLTTWEKLKSFKSIQQMCNYSLSAVDVCPCSMFGGGVAPPTDVESIEVDISALVASSETEISSIPMSSITAVVTAESLLAGIPGSALLVLVFSAVDVCPCSMFGGGVAPPTDVESTELKLSAIVASTETELARLMTHWFLMGSQDWEKYSIAWVFCVSISWDLLRFVCFILLQCRRVGNFL